MTELLLQAALALQSACACSCRWWRAEVAFLGSEGAGCGQVVVWWGAQIRVAALELVC